MTDKFNPESSIDLTIRLTAHRVALATALASLAKATGTDAQHLQGIADAILKNAEKWEVPEVHTSVYKDEIKAIFRLAVEAAPPTK